MSIFNRFAPESLTRPGSVRTGSAHPGSARIGPSENPSQTRKHSILERPPEQQNRTRHLAREASSWRRLALGEGALLLLMIVALVITSTRPHSMPYYVLVDTAGEFVDAGAIAETNWDAPEVREALLRRWIKDARTVYDSPVAQIDLVESALSKVGGQAAGYLEEYYQDPETNPVNLITRGQPRSVEVIEVVLPIRADDYRIQWVEKTMNAAGRTVKRERWEAIVSTTMRRPRTQEERRRNVSGFFIDELNWSPMATLNLDG